MNGYEIAIFDMADDTEMNAIQAALTEAGIEGADYDGIGMYLKDGKTRSVFVTPIFVTRAVKVINSLGYETDEDERDEE